MTENDVTDAPTLNRDRLVKVAVWVAGEYAKDELGLPSEWSQGHWLTQFGTAYPEQAPACGTACCVAGKVALDDGLVPLFEGDESDRPKWTRWTGRATLPNGDDVHVSDYAQEALGLHDYQANRLFSGSNDLDEVLTAIRDFLDDDPNRPVGR